MFHWWAAPTTLQPLHGGAVGRHGVGVLVVGPSGAGKSTTTLACLEAGMEYAGDDYVIVDVDEPTVHSLYSTVKLEPDNLDRFPTLAPLVANAGRLESQKAIVRLHEHRGDRLVNSLRLRAIVLPRVTGAACLARSAGFAGGRTPGARSDHFVPPARLRPRGRRQACCAGPQAAVLQLEAGTDLDDLVRHGSRSLVES